MLTCSAIRDGECRCTGYDLLLDVHVRPIASLIAVEAATLSDIGLHLHLAASFGRVRDAHIGFDGHHYLPITARSRSGPETVFEIGPPVREAFRASTAPRPARSGYPAPEYRGPPLVACSLVKVAASMRSICERGATVELTAPLVAGEQVLIEFADRSALKAVVDRASDHRADLRFDRLAEPHTQAGRDG